MQVGFIGLGTMGAYMVANLQKAGHKLVVHDIVETSATNALKAGAKWAANPKALAAECDLIFTSLPGPPEVEAVATGPDGLIEGMKAGSTWFDLSTNSPTVVRKLEALFKAKGLNMLDAPVSGGPRGAQSAKMAIWVGGDEALFDTHKPVLDDARYDAFVAALDNPPPPGPKLRALLRRTPAWQV